MKAIQISQIPAKINTGITIPASKSISNRVLVIRALCDAPFTIQNISKADDTVLMDSLFKSTQNELFVKNAGTVARFLLPYFASRPSDVILKGDDRMNERPIGDLVKALDELGADIEYLDKQGHLPVHIHGRRITGGQVSISADQSSQFISALLLIAPTLKEGLTIQVSDDPVSEPYINMTLETMHYFGIQFEKQAHRIAVPFQKYNPRPFFVESDWSSASYFLALAALFPGSKLVIPDLFETSVQGDQVILQLIREFGVVVSFQENECRIESSASYPSHFSFDFLNYPDLVPTLVCLCCALQVPFSISGTRTLKHKESNRADVLQSELKKLGYFIDVEENTMTFEGNKSDIKSAKITLHTHADHRMAMAFALLASKNPDICIENPDVVDKSFPDFWEQLFQLGFSLNLSDI